tara:strand:+ start:5837 stop:6109 length:273 start_codon:yes stop_codon:yes gene_type:complete
LWWLFLAKGKIMNIAARSFSDPSSVRADNTHTARKREVECRQSATPVKRIVDRDTGAHVGWLYEWNTGKLVPMWVGNPCENVAYVGKGQV